MSARTTCKDWILVLIIMNMKYKVSVIVPIYNVAKFLARCVKSLMEQTLAEVEFIFVNDATPDNSWNVLNDVLKKYPARRSDVVLLEHDVNKGLPAARNTGLGVAHGEYIFHCDSDDFVEHDMLESLYNKAVNDNSDIVWCDYFLSYVGSERYMKQPSYSTSHEALVAMLCGRMKYNVWNKLVKRCLYVDNNIFFPSGNAMGEDMTMMMLFPFASKVTYLHRAFYHYVQWNDTSLTKKFSLYKLEPLKKNADRIIVFLSGLSDETWMHEINSFKLLVKWPFLITNKYSFYYLWQKWYPEANESIWDCKYVSKRIKFIEWCASKRMYWIVWLHYWVVLKFFYSILYK